MKTLETMRRELTILEKDPPCMNENPTIFGLKMMRIASLQLDIAEFLLAQQREERSPVVSAS